MAPATESLRAERHPFIKGFHGIRYHVKDVARAVTFYTQHVGFELEHQHLPEIASVSLGEARILLSGPGASGSRPMPDGEPQEPGGWNRVVLNVSDLPGFITELKKAGLRFRNEVRLVPLVDRSKSKIRMAIRSSSSNQLVNRTIVDRDGPSNVHSGDQVALYEQRDELTHRLSRLPNQLWC